MVIVKKPDHLESLDVDVMTLKWTLNKEDKSAQFGLFWLRMETI
jgi:hypothetical protein